MAAVVEGAAIIKAGLFDDVTHAVHERRTTIPTCLNIAGGSDVVVRTSNTRAPRGPAPGDIARNRIASLLKQREEFQKLAGIGWVHGNVEAKGCLHRHHHAVAIRIGNTTLIER